MDQPTLGSNYPNMPSVHDIAATLAEPRRRPPLMRRVSRSDTNLDLPGGENPIHHVLSGIFEVNSSVGLNNLGGADRQDAAHLAMPSDETRSASAAITPTSIESPPSSQPLERNFSAFNLGLLNSSPNDNSSGLRKTASFIHGTNFGLCAKPTSSSLLHFPPNFHVGSGNHQVTVPAAPTHDDPHLNGGLTMSVRSANTLAQPVPLHQSSSMGLFNGGGKNDVTTSAGGLVTNSSSESLNTVPHKTGVMGMFGRGFFAKPVVRSEEENYRYIMALDR